MTTIPTYDVRRIVCWLVNRFERGDDLTAALAWAAEHRREFDPAELAALWPVAVQCMRNEELFRGSDNGCRLCDIPGVVLYGSPL